MNQHTIAAKNWLDRRYSRNGSGGYRAHQPIYGIGTDGAEPNAVLRFARTYRLIQRLHGLTFDSVLDVGGGEGYLTAIIRDLFGTPVAHSSDLSVEACRRAGEIFGIHGVAADATRVPFAEKSYDLVVCSEVIEHLSRPVAAIAELARVARKYVIISTAEFCPTGELERWLRWCMLDTSYPHAEMNWFTVDDFCGLLGHDVAFGSQYRNLEYLLPRVEWNRARVESALSLLTSSDGIDVDHAGVILIAPRYGAAIPARAPISEQRRQQILHRLLEPSIAPAEVSDDAAPHRSLVERLHCVRCHKAVAVAGNQLSCVSCAHTYEVRGGVPSMVIEDAESATESSTEQWVAVLGSGVPSREASVRRVVDRLHHGGRDNAVWKQRIAAQLLRVLWLCSRREPLSVKATRLIRQLTGRLPLGADQVRMALTSDVPSRPSSAAGQDDGMSGARA